MVATLLLGLVAGVGVATSGITPTGVGIADWLWSILAGLAVTAAGSRADRRVLLVAGAVGALAAWGPWSAAGLGAMALASGVVLQRRGRIVGEGAMHAASAGLTLQALVRVHTWDGLPFGAAELAAAAILGALLVAGWWNSRRWIRASLAVVGALGLLGVAAMTLSLWRIVDDGPYSTGTALATDGTLASLDDLAASAEDLAEVEVQLADLQARVDTPLLAPLRYLPLTAQHVRAIDTTIEVSLDLAGRAGDGAALVEGAELRPGPGQVDVAAVRSLEAPLAEMVASLQAAEGELARVNSRWLVGPVRNATRGLAAASAEVLPTTELALLGVQTVPGMLGADGPRRWLVQLVDTDTGTSEWQVVVADNGRLIPTEEKGREDAVQSSGVGLSTEELAGATSFAQAATEATRRFESATGTSVDGILALSGEAARRVILSTGSQLLTDESRPRLNDLLAALDREQVPSPAPLAVALGEAASVGDIRIWADHAPVNRFFARIGLSDDPLVTLPPNTNPQDQAMRSETSPGCAAGLFLEQIRLASPEPIRRLNGYGCFGREAIALATASTGSRILTFLKVRSGDWETVQSVRVADLQSTQLPTGFEVEDVENLLNKAG